MKKDTVLELLEEAGWEEIVRKLTFFAYGQARRYPWRSRSYKILPGGKTPEDIAVEAIEKVWNGKRDWDPERHPSLLLHLEWIVRSDMGHLFESTQHQKTMRFPEIGNALEEPANPGEPSAFQGGFDRPSGILDPERELMLQEQQELEDSVKAELSAVVEGDEDLGLLLLCFEEGLDKPEAIAEQMGWEVTKVYNLKKKLLRRAASIKERLEKDGRQVKGKI